MHILAEICTRGRYDTTLPLAVQAVINQTRPPDALLIVDDNPPETRLEKLEKHPLLDAILASAGSIVVAEAHGPGKGPHVNHEFARTCPEAKGLIWRVDDDEVPSPDVLERLEKLLLSDKKIGAAGGLVLSPGMPGVNPYASSALEDMFWCKNRQWYRQEAVPFEAGHLHSTYLYRKNAARYPKGLSAVGHCEETWHTAEMRRRGFHLWVDPLAVTRHYRQVNGGIRSQSGDYAGDEAKFRVWLEKNKVRLRKIVPVIIAQGLGDCYAGLQALPDILKFHKDADEVLVFVRPEQLVAFTQFAGGKVSVLPAGEMAHYAFKVDANVYAGWDGKGHLVDRYREKYCR